MLFVIFSQTIRYTRKLIELIGNSKIYNFYSYDFFRICDENVFWFWGREFWAEFEVEYVFALFLRNY